MAPLNWLRESPFVPMPSELPEIIISNLPAQEPGFGSGELPSGNINQLMEVEYQRPIDDQVFVEDAIQVQFFSYESQVARAEHLELLESQSYEWAFEEIYGYGIVLYYTSGVDGRVWISGPFLIIIYSGLDTSERGPRVELFTELYLERFTPTGSSPESGGNSRDSHTQQ